MSRFLEITTDKTTTRTFVNIDKANVVELAHDSVTFYFDDPGSKVVLTDINVASYEKIRRLFGEYVNVSP